MGLNVAVLANLKKNAPNCPGMPPDAWAELDSETTTEAIVAALEAAGHRATYLEGNVSLVERLVALKPDICFNICEGHWGDSRESQIPAILEMLRIPYTGSGPLTLALALDKPMTKRVLMSYGLPIPEFQVFKRADEPIDRDLRFPLFVKPSREGTSMGVSARSIVRNAVELRERVAEHLESYRQPILVERFICGREFTVGVIGNLMMPAGSDIPREGYEKHASAGLRFLPALEVDFSKYPSSEGGVYTNRIKTEWAHDYHVLCPAPLAPEQVATLRRLTSAAFRATGCLDFARVDFRLDAGDGDRPYILEVNPLPGLHPGLSDMVLEAEGMGMKYNTLVNAIFDAARARQGPD
jgi:D-alanine-D-alanine ligase